VGARRDGTVPGPVKDAPAREPATPERSGAEPVRGLDARALLKPALLATLVHLALLALWPLVRPVYAPVFRALAQFAVNVVDPLPGPIEARFAPGEGGVLATDLVRVDTFVKLRHRDMQGADATMGASSFFHAWLPTTVLVALFASALGRTWRKKPLLIGLLLLHAFFAARCVLAVYYAYSRSSIEGRPAVELGPTSTRLLHLVWHFGWEEMFANYLVPLLIFGVCVFEPRSERGLER